LLQSVGGRISTVGGREQTATTPQQGGSDFSSYLTSALDPSGGLGEGGSAAATGSTAGFNALPERSYMLQPWQEVAKAPDDITSFNTLDWPGAYRPVAGADSGGLPQAKSTYQGGYFDDQVSLSPAQRVGGDIFQFHFGHIVQKDGVYYSYFIDHSGGSQNDVGLATSTDGVNWDYKGKVLQKGAEYDAKQASFPDVKYDEDSKTWYMVYEGKADHDDINSVCLATSPDGVNWTKQGPIISPGQAGDMSATDVGTPTLYKENGVWNVYFHGLGNDGRVRIGYASGTDLKHLNVKQGALIDVDASGAESGTVGARSSVVKLGDYYYMAYEVCTANKDFGESQWGTSLARATSPDGPWEKIQSGPILENPREGFGYDGPELSLQGSGLYLYYRLPGNGTARCEVTGLG
jgi:predicted GH43/DUF377 family glycosyl hydrolase